MLLSELQGLIPTEVGETLARYASQVKPPQVIVEIGSYKGKSTCYLASETEAHVYAIDPWDSPGNVNGRFRFAQPSTRLWFAHQVKSMGYEKKITAIQAEGHEVGLEWTEHVGLLFIDGDHSAQAVERDVLAWSWAVDGWIILDDLDTPKNPGVRQAALKLNKLFGQAFTVEAERLAIWKL